ncbi:MAG: threonylcarbamoyl-AMP synthase [Actinobacteria bacterium]|uniref:Threonylcarbamoyl-AMP synthase n=1 Tax=freshwater metagenome TaxID=449393 RepID=A0A6J6TP16_9ZZZZ|nr:threonylcarbamoyl-AMP synthase [Actinomycetota bacterium]
MQNYASRILDGNLSTSIELAIDNLRNDLLIGLPTETVYGLAALASHPKAISKIFQVKARPTNHPLILHIADYQQLEKWAKDIPQYARNICKHFWPGPLTVILMRTENVCDEITGDRETVAIRIPNHKVALSLLNSLNDGLVAPSANRFGKVSPTSAKHVIDDLGDDVSLVLDGGNCEIGVESTIIDCSSSRPQILRSGAISIIELEEIGKIKIAQSDGISRASGMLEKHYAPNCQVELVDSSQQALQRFDEISAQGLAVEIVDFYDDLEMYAKQLYARLRQADERKIHTVLAVMPSKGGLGDAIRDRLIKAAASN